MNSSIDQDIDLEKLADSSHLLDILLSCENVLDSLDVYSFSSWVSGQVVAGPIVRRHWVSFSLLYPHNKMPDPRAALRLLKHGVQVEFNSVKRAQADGPGHPDAEPSKDTDWLIKITIPRRLLDQMDGADLEMYDDEVNPDDVTAAKDIGLDDESQYQTDEQLGADGTPAGGLPDQPMQPQGQPNVQPPQF